MGRRQLYNTDEERATARRASQKKHNKNRNSPDQETILRQSMKDKRRRIEAGSKEPQDYADTTNNHHSNVQQPILFQNTYNCNPFLNWNYHLMQCKIPYHDYRMGYHQLMTIQSAPISIDASICPRPDNYSKLTSSLPVANQHTDTDSKELKSKSNRLAYERRKLKDKYKKLYGAQVVDELHKYNHLEFKNINGNIVPHLTHTARRMLMASVIVSSSASPVSLLNNNGHQTTTHEQNITDKDSTLQTESVVGTKSNTTTPTTQLNPSPIPVPSVCMSNSSSNDDNAYDQDTDNEDATHLDSKPSPVPSSCTSGNLDIGYDLDTDNEDMDDEEKGSDVNTVKTEALKEEDTSDE